MQKDENLMNEDAIPVAEDIHKMMQTIDDRLQLSIEECKIH